MYEIHDWIVITLSYGSALLQLSPAYFAWRTCHINGYAKYWTEGWYLFILIMCWIGFRRLLAAINYDPGCIITSIWLFDNVISVWVTSVGLSAFAILKYKFFSYWIDPENLKKRKE